ncbi:hypothetical protein C8J57DRAFT_1525735 [Mycena rebaudengoi]|nr:hypothetical protein C8J57DRAFT_1525735 [Mycena rebaudengoi]
MPAGTARGAAAVGVHGHTVYLAGGLLELNLITGAQPSSAAVSAFNTLTHRWSVLPSLPEARDHVGGFTYHSLDSLPIAFVPLLLVCGIFEHRIEESEHLPVVGTSGTRTIDHALWQQPVPTAVVPVELQTAVNCSMPKA